ncbi:MAG TPA: PilZ domain-containing protein [Polyangiaceae bacterium]|nr:PilZ domain-containing protein [Polyangiaceae bacterium]
MPPTPPHERRGFPRGYVAALASVLVNERHAGDFVVRDLSAGGALLVNGPLLPTGVECTVRLRVPGLGPLRVTAYTVHSAVVGNDRYAMGIRFTRLSPAVAEGLRELVDQELDRAAQPSVLVADDDLSRLSDLAEDLADLGERPLLALTPLEVIHWLCDPETTVELALLSEELHQKSGSGVFDFVRGEFPHVRAVLLKDTLAREELRELLEWAAGPARSARQLKATQGYNTV